MIRLENVLKISLQDVLKTSWKRLEYVLKTFGQDEYIGFDQDVLKTSSEVVSLRRTYSSWSRRLEDIFKTSSEDEDERRLKDVLKTSLSRRMFAGMLPIYWVNVLVMCKSLDIFFVLLFFYFQWQQLFLSYWLRKELRFVLQIWMEGENLWNIYSIFWLS